MARYKSKLKIVEATRLDTHEGMLPVGVTVETTTDGLPRYYVTTIQGQKVEVKEGEWIIDEPDSIHHYPCAHTIFKDRYDLLDESNRFVLFGGITFILCMLRVFGNKSEFFQAIAHLYVGGLFAAWYVGKNRFWLVLGIILTVVEIACFTYFALRHH